MDKLQPEDIRTTFIGERPGAEKTTGPGSPDPGPGPHGDGDAPTDPGGDKD